MVIAELTENAKTLLQKRYLEPNETINQMFHRVAGGNEKFEELMTSLRFLPNSPTLMNKGIKNDSRTTFSACFKFDISDTMFGDDYFNPDENSIFETGRKAAMVAKWGGGVGYYLGNLRPKGATIRSVHRAACGPVSVMKWLNDIGIYLITQGGRRELAQMAILPTYHQDFQEFIHAKDKDPQKLRTFNISASCNDEFMRLSLQSGTKEFDLWKEMSESAWKTGDPGCYFYDNAERTNPTPHLGNLTGTNPCLTGDTLVYVADGRTAVPIKLLAEEARDIPVFCIDDDKKITIRTMRHPRLTGYKEAIYKLTLDDSLTIRVTANHKFKLRNGHYVSVKELKPGDSLSLLTRYIPPENSTSDKSYADRYIGLQMSGKYIFEHRLIAEYSIGRLILANEHVHHKDGNRFNNSINNLEVIPEVIHLSEHTQGINNPNFSGISNEQLIAYGLQLVRKLGRRFSKKEWQEFASENMLPVKFSNWREKTLGTLSSFSKLCAIKEGLHQFNDVDPCVAKTYQRMIEYGLNAKIINNEVIIIKNCEFCNKNFTVNASYREICFCSVSCARKKTNRKHNQDKVFISTRTATNKIIVANKQKIIREQQLDVYTKLKNKLGRQPLKKEWVNACKIINISHEISRKSSPFRNYADLVDKANEFNHRVVSIEFDGYEDVYNGTVDDFHNFFVGGWDGGITNNGRKKTYWINNQQCGEVCLLNNEPCNLGSLNLSKFVTTNLTVNWDWLEETVIYAIRFLDHILDCNHFPHPAITKAAMLTRKLGLGVMGWGDMLCLLNIHYNTQEALKLATKLASFINEIAKNISIKLAKENKGPYPGSNGDPCRNATRTCIAPTGSIYLIAGVDSSGIEPHYALESERTMGDGTVLKERVSCIERSGNFIPKTAMEIPWEWHVRHQATWQEHIDLACSKTINLPNSATPEEISKAYRMMHNLGCKGGTIYRDNCRNEQVLRDTSKTKTFIPTPSTNGSSRPTTTILALQKETGRKKPPKTRNAVIHKFKIDGFKGYLHVGMYDDGKPCEIFIEAAKEGTTISGLIDSWAKSISLNLQTGCTLEDLIRMFGGMRFEPSGMTDDKDIPLTTSIVDYVVRWLDRYFNHRNAEDFKGTPILGTGMLCPECNSMAILQGGCLSCSRGCGWSRCG